jgi:DNA polymerase-3 subunit beta
MLISLSRQRLNEQLQIVAKAVPAKSTNPSLEGIYLEIKPRDSGLALITVAAANTEIVLNVSSLHDISESLESTNLALVLPARVQEIIRRLPGETVQLLFDWENFAVTIRSQAPADWNHGSDSQLLSLDSEFQVYGYDALDFPKQEPFTAPDLSLSLKSSDLRTSLRQVLFAVSTDESKPTFTGVHFKLQGEKLILSASDTFRVAATSCSVTDCQAPGDGNVSFLVPGKLMQECLRVFGESGRFLTEQTVRFTLSRNKLLLERSSSGQTGTELRISSRLLDENFPDIERVYPKEFAGSSVVLTRELAASLERALCLTEAGTQALKFVFEQNSLTIKASSRYGNVQERLGALGKGADLEIYLNAKFLLDMLKICEGEEVFFQFTGPNRGVLLKDTLHEEFRYFILPVKS